MREIAMYAAGVAADEVAPAKPLDEVAGEREPKEARKK